MKKSKKQQIDKNKNILVRGAKLHNLKNISVDIPRNKLTVITGVSGSGKSSLAFDTIYAEGQRRFVESLSAYARQFLERMQKPEVEIISGLPPAIAIEQHSPQKNPRSTVGTSTEVYDYIRLLYGRIGITICKNCGRTVKKDSPQTALNEILKWNENDKLIILFPPNQQLKELEEELSDYISTGYFRIQLKKSGTILNLQEASIPNGTKLSDILIVADRLSLRKDKESISRLSESLEMAFIKGTGRIIVQNLTENLSLKFSNQYECSDCDILYIEPEPKLFSFNNPFGACPHCQGFGRSIGIDDDLIFPERNKSIRKGAIHPFRTIGFSQYQRDLLKVASRYGFPLDIAVSELNDEQFRFLWDGRDEYAGINDFFTKLEEQSYKLHYRVLLSRYRGYTTCKQCGGSRLRTSARQVFVGGLNIPNLIKLNLGELQKFFNEIELNETQISIISHVLREIMWRLELLVDIGLEYLTLDRLTHTLSGGEAQRINLSTALGSSLVGTLYVLDEPSIGLHPRDTGRLLNILYKLRNLGNTIITVEHDLDIITKSDYIIDLGPAAGEFGGEVIFAGARDELIKSKDSLTAKYLRAEDGYMLNNANEISFNQSQSELSTNDVVNNKSKGVPGNGNSIVIYEPRMHNLKMNQVEFPLGCMIAVTGVSGSGKSTLVHDVLYSSLKKSTPSLDNGIGRFKDITGTNHISGAELVDQAPIGKSSRSTPATYTKAFDAIRDVFATTQLARQFGWKPGYFSFNVPGGRCDVCDGEGMVTIDMQFLPDVQLECEACKGTRYKKEVRNCLFRGKSIVDVLNMTIAEAIQFFDGISKITRKLQILSEVGLDYLRLGQPSTKLSGGESQRIKLANHLDTNLSENYLFIFDEPTTGLHPHDISKLLKSFRRLLKSGHSLIVIEHNLQLISSSDWIIDIGPDAGYNGGEIVFTGQPKQIINHPNSYTGSALKDFFSNQP